MTRKTRRSGEYSSAYIRLLFDYLERHNVDAARLLGEAKPDVRADAAKRYTVEQWRDWLALAAAELGDDLLSLHLGQSITPAHLGIVGYVLQSCPTLGAALQRLEAFESLISNVAYVKTNRSGGEIAIGWTDAKTTLGRLVDETAMTAYVQFGRHLTGKTNVLKRIDFVHERPAEAARYEDYFRCEVRFSQPENCIVIADSVLELPLQQADSSLLDIIEKQAVDLMAGRAAGTELLRSVRSIIVQLSCEGDLDIERAASRLNMSSRTLHRRMAEEGIHFRMLCNETRCELAKEYLKNRRMTLGEIAWLLGYTEQSAFSRAFRRWTGMPPANWRKENV